MQELSTITNVKASYDSWFSQQAFPRWHLELQYTPSLTHLHLLLSHFPLQSHRTLWPCPPTFNCALNPLSCNAFLRGLTLKTTLYPLNNSGPPYQWAEWPFFIFLPMHYCKLRTKATVALELSFPMVQFSSKNIDVSKSYGRYSTDQWTHEKNCNILLNYIGSQRRSWRSYSVVAAIKTVALELSFPMVQFSSKILIWAKVMAETVQKGNGASLKWLCLVTEILMPSKFPAKNKKFNPIIYNGRPLYKTGQIKTSMPDFPPLFTFFTKNKELNWRQRYLLWFCLK